LKSNFPYTQGSVRKLIPPHLYSWPSEVTESNHQRLFKNKGTYCSLYDHVHFSLPCLNNKNTTYPELFILCFKHHKIISFPKLRLTYLKVSDNGILVQLLFLDIIFIYKKNNVFETGLCLNVHAKPTQLGLPVCIKGQALLIGPN
jgi:hypothetical protein